MQPLTISPHSDRHYLLPFPKNMSAESPELLGFFVYELRVGHDCWRWSTANGRFGLPLRVAGVQHPAPQLRCAVTRSFTSITVKAPFASPIWEGRNFRPPHQPNTRLQALLYAQVRQVDGQSWRNVLLMSAMGSIDFNFNDIGPREDIRRALALMQFPQDDILNRLSILGLPPDSSLSVIAAELLPEPGSPFDDPLGVNLGQVRILRTTPLTAVPAICPPL